MENAKEEKKVNKDKDRSRGIHFLHLAYDAGKTGRQKDRKRGHERR